MGSEKELSHSYSRWTLFLWSRVNRDHSLSTMSYRKGLGYLIDQCCLNETVWVRMANTALTPGLFSYLRFWVRIPSTSPLLLSGLPVVCPEWGMLGTVGENSPQFRASCFWLGCACVWRVKTGLVSFHTHLVFIIRLPMQAPCFLSFK